MITVRSFKSSDSKLFYGLNVAWIEKYFEIEREDRVVLEDPEGAIIDKGGIILTAESEGDIVGVVALIPTKDRFTIELAKMAVRDDARKSGVGTALMKSAIDSARKMGVQRIWLETNTKLEAAIGLYRKFNFRELAEGELIEAPYVRCNLQMLREL